MLFGGLPYVYDPNTGYMVFTKVTIEDQTRMMWLPVMDGANKAMKEKDYTYSTRYGDKTVDAASMFDVNKTIMRCLVKNIAMFGLGIYIFSGEDLPDGEGTATVVNTKPLAEIVKGDENWLKVEKYVKDNKQLGIDTITQQLGRKYLITPATEKELLKIINNG
jgi:Protein of unknown function (DUF1071).